MRALLTLAWRNVWRNGRRSLITMVSLASGLAAIMAGQSLIKTIQLSLIEKATGVMTGHIQIMPAGVRQLRWPEKNIARTKEVERILGGLPGIAAFEQNIRATGLISSKKDSIGVMICAVQPDRDGNVLTMNEYIKQGSFLKGSKPGLVLGRVLADSLGVKLGDSVVLLTQASDGSMGAMNFDVTGVFHAGSQTFDAGVVYVPLERLQAMLALDGVVNDFVIRLKEPDRLDAAQSEIASALRGLGVDVLTWRDIDKELVGIQKYQNAILKIMLVIVFAIVALGVLNTLLMSLFERIREFGVLLAIGAKPGWVVRLILLEACLLGAVGVALGLAAGSAIIGYFHWAGLPLPIGDTFSYFLPFPTVLFLRFHWPTHVAAVAAVFLTCVLAALTPALRASRLKPSDALRSI